MERKLKPDPFHNVNRYLLQLARIRLYDRPVMRAEMFLEKLLTRLRKLGAPKEHFASYEHLLALWRGCGGKTLFDTDVPYSDRLETALEKGDGGTAHYDRLPHRYGNSPLA